MNRKTILENAIIHTCGERDVEYGPPKINLSDTARLWNAHLIGKYDLPAILTAEDVAWFNVLQKISRTYNGNAKVDTFEDAAAFSAIAGECANES